MDMYIKKEENRIKGLGLIASENYPPLSVLQANGCILTGKYAEGYADKRYYSGSGPAIDPIERLTIERLIKIYTGAEHANVQPHSGSNANMAAYFALIELGDRVLGFDLSCGGHLTHGSPANFSWKLYKFAHYGVGEDGYLDYDEIYKTAVEHEPKLIVAGATAYPRVIDFARFREIADDVGAYLMVDMAHIAGLVAAGLHPSPVGYAHAVTSTTHKTLMGPRGGFILCDEEFAEAIDTAVFPGIQGGPLMNAIAAKGVAFKVALTPEFREYSKYVVDDAAYLAENLNGLGFNLVTYGTDNHLMLVDLTDMGITGKEASNQLEDAEIFANKNMIPGDKRKPVETSGLRIGTPIMAARGMGPDDMPQVASFINTVLRSGGDEKIIAKTKEAVREFCSDFPLYPELPEEYTIKELPPREFERV